MNLSEYALRFIDKPYEWAGYSWCESYVRAWLEYFGMTEIKTFKSPVEVRRFLDNWRVDTLESDDFFHFDFADWDMEVTFTRKVKPPKFKAGDRVNTKEGDGFSEYPGTVVAVDTDGVYVVWDVNPTVVQTFWVEEELYLVS